MDYEEAKAKLDTWAVEMMRLEEKARKRGDHKLEDQAAFAWQSLESARIHVENISNLETQ